MALSEWHHLIAPFGVRFFFILTCGRFCSLPSACKECALHRLIGEPFEVFCTAQHGIEWRNVPEDHSCHGFIVFFKGLSHRAAGCQRETAGYSNTEPQIGATEKQACMTRTVGRQRMIALPAGGRRGLHQLMHIVVMARDALPAVSQLTAPIMPLP